MLSILFGINGRYGRLEWWLMQLLGTMINVTCASLIIIFMGVEPALNSPIPLEFEILVVVTSIVSIWIGIAATIRRYHDRNKSGWWILIGLIPFVCIIVLIECGFFRGTDGANYYGDDNSFGSKAPSANGRKDAVSARYDNAAQQAAAGEGRQPVKINRPSDTRFGRRTTTPFGS